jgi:hypothetical protein
VVGVYVDDLLIVGECMKDIDQFKEEMKQSFCMSDLGPLSYYLGIEVRRSRHGVELCQSAFAKKLIEKAGMAWCNGCVMPMEPKLKLSKRSTTPAVDATQYHIIIGSPRYLLHTRTDLTFSVGFPSRFMEDPKEDHVEALKHLLWYVTVTTEFGLQYARGEGELRLLGYSYSDLAADVDGRRSTTGVLFFLGGSSVTWLSKKQTTMAKLSCEVEYMASAAAAAQGLWL